MTYAVRLMDQDESFEVHEGESILDGALRAGVKLPHECTFGGCGTCKVKVHQGSVHYEDMPMALTEEEHRAGYALACQARCGESLIIEPCALANDFAEPVTVTATVAVVERLAPDVMRLALSIPDDLAALYVPGQYMNIVLPDGRTRSFSMASAHKPGQPLEFHIKQIEHGYFTSDVLPSLVPGATLSIHFPLGTFAYRENDWRPMIMAATGTGIAPIRAMLESLLDNEDCPPITLYWGVRSEADLYAAAEISTWVHRLYEFQFIPVLSRASDTWTGRRGYVQDAITDDHHDLSEHAFYLCGSPDMIEQAQKAFVQRGADLEYIYSDSFTFSATQASALA